MKKEEAIDQLESLKDFHLIGAKHAEAIQYAIDHLFRQEWISVEEAEKNKSYLVATKLHPHIPHQYESAIFNGSRFVDKYGNIIFNIVAIQPLPTPPGADKTEGK